MLRIQQPSRKKPTWSWDFAAKGSLPPGATYTGNGGNGTRFNSAGVLVQSVNNVARFDYDPVTHAPLGYLAEMASTNSLLQSEAFDSASWNGDGGRTTVTANAAIAPDGNMTADKLIPSAANTYHDRYNGAAPAITANAPLSASLFVKAAELSAVTLNIFGATSTKWVSVTFDLATGTVSKSQAGAGGTFISASIRALSNGWYRISFIGSLNDTIVNWLVEANNTTTPTYSSWGLSAGYAGNASDGLYVWGAQMELGGVGVTSYIPTAGATVTRAVDLLTLPLTSLPGWSAAQGGVFTAAYRLNTKYPASPGYNQPPIEIQAADYQNSVQMLANYGGANQYGGWSASGGTVAIAYGGTTVAPFTRRKQSIGWTVNRVVNCADGGAPLLTVLAVALPVAPATMYFGLYGTSGHALGGALESIAYYRGARSDAFVQQVSR